VSRYIENDGYPESNKVKVVRKSMLDPEMGNISAWLEEDMECKATWILDI